MSNLKDFEDVQRYDVTSAGASPDPVDGFWVTYEDYQTLLKAYQEIKWMYEGLCE